MTIPDAVDLILKAAQIAHGGEGFILKMPALKIVDLASVMIEALAKKTVALKVIGKRPGEKLYEKIVTRTEATQALELKEMYVLPLSIDYPTQAEDVVEKSYDYYKELGGRPVPENGVEPKVFLTKEQIKQLLIKAQII